jgi:uncharacterized protein
MSGSMGAKLRALRSQAGSRDAVSSLGPAAVDIIEFAATSSVPSPSAPPSSVSATPPLSNGALRLERLRSQGALRARGRGHLTMTLETLAERVKGKVISPGLIEHQSAIQYPMDCGTAKLDGSVLDSAAFFFDSDSGVNIDRLLVLDTETSGLAGGTGTVPFLVGVLVVEREHARLYQWLMTRFDGEVGMLQRLAKLIGRGSAERDRIVTYNGASFDLPLIETRARLAGNHLGLDGIAHLDVLHRVRRAFGGRWPDCKLQTAERRLLNFTRVDDVPGAEVPERWFEWMRRGNGDGLIPVLEHNRLDLVNLAAVLPSLCSIYRRPAHHGARIVSVLRDRLTEADLYDVLRTHETVLDRPERLELARLAKRAGAIDVALGQLEPLAQGGEPQAMVQLAKLYEHQLGRFDRALELTVALQADAPAESEHAVRRVRLEGKIARGAQCALRSDNAPVAQQDRAAAS